MDIAVIVMGVGGRGQNIRLDNGGFDDVGAMSMTQFSSQARPPRGSPNALLRWFVET